MWRRFLAMLLVFSASAFAKIVAFHVLDATLDRWALWFWLLLVILVGIVRAFPWPFED